ncbi:MAG: hemagglutinin repeat-containing protein, partial [Ramlibacter sp.]
AGVRAGQQQSIAAVQTSFATQAAARPVPTVPSEALIARAANPPAIKAAGYTTATAKGPLNAPASRLFRINGAPGAGYLVETDPAFTDYGRFLGSDWMLAQLELDPERTMKRYGDAFAEQRLVDDQIFAMTGRRFLAGYGATEDEYQDLLNAGVMFARGYQLTPGVALSGEQMASLTTDIVWLESKTVTLPDGSTTQALVPTVYLRRPVAGDLSPTGSLISGSNIELRNPGGDLSNSGTLYAHGGNNMGGTLTLEAANVSNSGTLAGNAIAVKATNDIVNAGGQIAGIGAASTVALGAGRDIVLRTTTQTTAHTLEGPGGTTRASSTSVDRIATVNADSITLAALGNIALEGAKLTASGNLGLGAAGAITVGTVLERYNLDAGLGVASQPGESGATGARDRTSHYRVESVSNVGTQLTAGNNIALSAGEAVTAIGSAMNATGSISISAASVTLQAARDSLAIDQQGVSKRGYERLARSDEMLAGGTVSAGGDLSVIARDNIVVQGASLVAEKSQASLIAGGDIKVDALITQHISQNESYSSRKGFMSSSSRERTDVSQGAIAQGSTLSGNTVLLQGARNVAITGSGVVADHDLQLTAGNNLSIEAAGNSETTGSTRLILGDGFGALGGISYGSSKRSLDGKSAAATAAPSTVGSLAGNVAITAGNAYSQVGSDLSAHGDIAIAAKTISITEARETSQSELHEKFKQGGVTVTVNSPILDAMRTVGQMASAGSQTSDTRMQALAAANAGMALNSANAAVTAGSAQKIVPGNNVSAGTARDATAVESVGGGKISISLISSRSQSDSQQQADTARGSSVRAGGDLSLIASGAGQTSGITMRGSDVIGMGAVKLQAEGDIHLLAAANTSSHQAVNSGSSASIGVGFAAGTQNGVTIDASLSRSQGRSSGESISWTHSHVIGGDSVSLQSGGDTSLKGAIVSAANVKAQVGGDLKIESLQDSNTYDAKQSSSGVSVSICVPPICYGASTASVSASKTKVESDYLSIAEQSGIQAGDGGFQVDVTGSTDLKGGAITSSDKAVTEGKNNFGTAGALTLSDLHNSAQFEGKSVGI